MSGTETRQETENLSGQSLQAASFGQDASHSVSQNDLEDANVEKTSSNHSTSKGHIQEVNAY
jgi:hypothetical protein